MTVPALETHSVRFEIAQKSLKSTNISYDKTSERATIEFPESVQVGENVLVVDFTGTINNHMAGFCRAKYNSAGEPAAGTPKEGDQHVMMSTQFEACDARQAFPCFDEPNLKATFDFEVEIPKDLTALSNMPVKSTRDGPTEGRQFVTFERTPVMSTYVCSAWFIGPLSGY